MASAEELRLPISGSGAGGADSAGKAGVGGAAGAAADERTCLINADVVKRSDAPDAAGLNEEETQLKDRTSRRMNIQER